MRQFGLKIAFLVLLLAYPASYLALLDPIYLEECSATRSVYQRTVIFRGFGLFSPAQRMAKSIYQPLIAFDQWLRPNYWSGEESVFGTSTNP